MANAAGWNAFHFAAYLGDVKCLDALARQGCRDDVDDLIDNMLVARTSKGKTPRETASGKAVDWYERVAA